MEPSDYLKALQRHWKVAVALVLTVVVVVLFLVPAKGDTVYEARHTLLRTSTTPEGTAAADNPRVLALWASRGTVPQRVAEAVGRTGPPDDLTDRLTVTPSVELGTVDLAVTADTEDEAVLLVNTFAEEALRYVNEQNQEARAAADDQVRQIQSEVDALGSRIAAAGGDSAPAAAGLVSQRAAKLDEQNAVAAEARANVSRWGSLQEASSAQPVSTSSVAVSRGQALLLGGLVALLLASGVAIMLDRSDSRLHTKEQAERQFGLPVLAEVPLLSLRHRRRAAVLGYEHDVGVAEAHRSLRTALLLFRDRLPLAVEAAELTRHGQPAPGRGASSSRQVVVVTSAEAGDGKSTTAANLAMAYAEAGQSALLVNWDLWRPTSARVLGAEGSPGVSELLEAEGASLVDYVHPTPVPGLHLLPSGRLGHQPGGRLDADLRLLEQARELADVVVVDTAPLLAASVTRELVTMADVVVLASRVGRATSPAAGRTVELLERLGAPTLGVVLVGVPRGPFRKDYYTGVPGPAVRSGGGVPRHDGDGPLSGDAHGGGAGPSGGDGRHRAAPDSPSAPSRGSAW
ncbi:MAG TPA: CpsD/CapB family tyrosine-protein kinase [Acidimicrobiales bacterium]|nr:CpsD/CapB family tyrosine-protein kinase [Acidimicrobiales bacterium]